MPSHSMRVVKYTPSAATNILVRGLIGDQFPGFDTINMSDSSVCEIGESCYAIDIDNDGFTLYPSDSTTPPLFLDSPIRFSVDQTPSTVSFENKCKLFISGFICGGAIMGLILCILEYYIGL